MLTADTLVIDTTTLRALQADKAYDYTRDFLHEDFNVIEWIANMVGKAFSAFFNSDFFGPDMVPLWITVALVLFVGALFFISRRHRNLFNTQGKSPLAYAVTQDTIYGIDFDKAIAQAFGDGNYREAIRLIYLQVLKQLDDSGRIQWQQSTTPSEYARQLPAPAFRQLTNMFLRIRYGDYPASQTLAEEATQLASQVVGQTERGGEA